VGNPIDGFGESDGVPCSTIGGISNSRDVFVGSKDVFVTPWGGVGKPNGAVDAADSHVAPTTDGIAPRKSLRAQ
jgi:hypothetical protein